jgi:invasion protein IalB
MCRAALLLLALILAVFGEAPSASAAKRVALVIGIDAYDNLPTLQKAVNDEKAVAAALAGLGFDVVSGENLTRREMNAKLSELDAKIAPGDTVFFYFAGHGVALGGENYLLLRDLPKPHDGEENLVRDEGHSVDALVRRVQGRGAALSFFVLDACRDNPLAASGVRSIGGTRGLTRVDTPNGVFVLFSAGIGQTALDRLGDDDHDQNSVFTRKLVPLLKTPGLTQVSLAKRVQSEVDALASSVHHPQQPAYYDQIIGEIELSPRKSSAEPASVSKVEDDKRLAAVQPHSALPSNATVEPGAAGVAKDSAGVWQANCRTPPGAREEKCVLALSLRPQDSSDFTPTLMIYKAIGEDKKLLRIVVPAPVLLASGIELKVDNLKVGNVPFLKCVKIACIAEAVVQDEVIKRMSIGNSATLIISDAPGRETAISVPLRGFREALANLK